MRNFEDSFETRKQLFIITFSISMPVPLRVQMFKQGDSLSSYKNDDCSSEQSFAANCEMVFVLTQKNASS